MNERRQFVTYFIGPVLLVLVLAAGVAFAIRVDLNNQALHLADNEQRQVAVQRLMDKSRHLELRMVAIKAELDTIKAEVRELQETIE